MPRSPNRILFYLLLGGVILAILFGLTWANYQYAKVNTPGNQFAINWLGTRLFLTEGKNPYSNATSIQIEKIEFGKPTQNQEERLFYQNPLYAIILFAPVALISDVVIAKSIWMTAMELALIALALIAIKISNWNLGLIEKLIFILFTLFWLYSVLPLINGDVVLLIALFYAAAILAFQKGEDELAGVLLAFSTIKPLFGFPLIIFLLIWSIKARRTKLLLWFFVSVALLTGSSLLLLPNWIIENVRAIFATIEASGFETNATLLQSILPGIGARLGWVLSIIVFLFLVVEWSRYKQTDSRKTAWITSLTLVGGAIIGLPANPVGIIILLPALPLIISVLQHRWNQVGLLIGVILILFLSIGMWGLFIPNKSIDSINALLFYPVVIPIFALLYWVRHWVMDSVYPWYDSLN